MNKSKKVCLYISPAFESKLAELKINIRLLCDESLFVQVHTKYIWLHQIIRLSKIWKRGVRKLG